MSFINHNSKEIYCKVIYVGPSGSGKTANVRWIYNQTTPDKTSELLKLPFSPTSNVFFEFLPMSIGNIRNFSTRLHLYTIPGGGLMQSTSKMILKGLDGIVFVADSDPLKLDQNIQCLNQLKASLKDEGLELKKIPLVIQYNKRDLENVETLSNLKLSLNHYNSPDIEAVATSGQGVMNTLQTIAKIIITVLKGGNLT